MQEQNISAEELARIEADALKDTDHWHSQAGPHREWHNAAYIAGAVTEYLRAAKSKQSAEDLSAPASPVEESAEDKWIISGEKTTQVSEDSWRRNTKTLAVTESTLLVKALQWAEDNGLDFDAGLTIRKLYTLPSKI